MEPEGTILIGSIIGPLYSIQEEGGALEEATRLRGGQNSHRWPQFLNDGRRFLLFTLGPPDVRGVYRGSATDANVERVSIENRVIGSCHQHTCCSPGKARCGPAAESRTHARRG